MKANFRILSTSNLWCNIIWPFNSRTIIL